MGVGKGGGELVGFVGVGVVHGDLSGWALEREIGQDVVRVVTGIRIDDLIWVWVSNTKKRRVDE